MNLENDRSSFPSQNKKFWEIFGWKGKKKARRKILDALDRQLHVAIIISGGRDIFGRRRYLPGLMNLR